MNPAMRYLVLYTWSTGGSVSNETDTDTVIMVSATPHGQLLTATTDA